MSDGKLLEELAAQADCYISSLRDVTERKRVFRILLEMDPARYGLEEWEYTLSYLIGNKVLFPGYDEMRRFLRENAG